MIHRTTSCRGLKTEVPKGVAHTMMLLGRVHRLSGAQHFLKPLQVRGLQSPGNLTAG